MYLYIIFINSCMGINKFIIGCLILGLQGCRPKVTMDIPEINPLKITKSIDQIDKYVNRVEVINLSSPDSIVVTGITKLLLGKKGNFILMDGTRLYRFSNKGEFQRQYGNVGRGPGEYLKIYDISLNKDHTELWCLNHMNAIIKYDLTTGKYIETVSTHSPKLKIPNASALIPADDNGFYLYVPNPSDESNLKNPFYCLKRFDKKGKLVEEELLRMDFNINMNMIPFVTQNFDNTYLLKPQENENICYCISNHGLSKKVKIHFGNENIPPLFSFQNVQNPWLNLEKFMASDYFKLPFNIQETKKKLFLSAFGPYNRIYYFLVDKDIMQGINWNSGDKFETTPFFIVGSDEEFFYGVFDKYLDPSVNTENLDPMLAYLMTVQHLHLNEDDNPIIVKIKFE